MNITSIGEPQTTKMPIIVAFQCVNSNFSKKVISIKSKKDVLAIL